MSYIKVYIVSLQKPRYSSLPVFRRKICFLTYLQDDIQSRNFFVQLMQILEIYGPFLRVTDTILNEIAIG